MRLLRRAKRVGGRNRRRSRLVTGRPVRGRSIAPRTRRDDKVHPRDWKPRPAESRRAGIDRQRSADAMRPTLRLALLSALLLPLAGCSGSAERPAPPRAESAQVGAAPTSSLHNVDQHAQPPTSGAEEPTVNPSTSKAAAEAAIFSAGCFWCIEAVLLRIDGVLGVESGYTGGTVDNPTYEQVCSGTTGHAESVRVQFDPRVLPYRKLCDWFFHAHAPTTRDPPPH